MKVQRTITLAVALVLVVLGAIACSSGSSTPTEAVKTLYRAIDKKDVGALKSVMPKAVLEDFEKEAKAKNKTVDDLIKDDLFKDLKPGTFNRKPDIREHLSDDGKTATVEIQDDIETKKVRLVKEDDGWKVRKEDW